MTAYFEVSVRRHLLNELLTQDIGRKNKYVHWLAHNSMPGLLSRLRTYTLPQLQGPSYSAARTALPKR